MRKLLWCVIIIQFITIKTNIFADDVNKREVIERTFQLSDNIEDRFLCIDNVFGSISIKGVAGNEVRAKIYRRVEARSSKALQRANEEIRLEISQQSDSIEFYVDGPFRCHDGSIRCRGDSYEVHYDFDLTVPVEIDVLLKTVNKGDIYVEKINGYYEVNNINGGVAMLDIAGAGRVYALNGDVEVKFTENPNDKSYFGSLNGEINLYFQSPLLADFRLKTFNGDVFSDFPVTHLPQKDISKVKKRGKNIYKCDNKFGVRAGKGGPEIELDGFNGDIHILERKN